MAADTKRNSKAPDGYGNDSVGVALLISRSGCRDALHNPIHNEPIAIATPPHQHFLLAKLRCIARAL